MNRKDFLYFGVASVPAWMLASTTTASAQQDAGRDAGCPELYLEPKPVYDAPEPLLWHPITTEDFNIVAIQWTYKGDIYGDWVKLDFTTTDKIVPQMKSLLLAYSKNKLALIDKEATWDKDVTNVKWAWNFNNEDTNWSDIGGKMKYGVQYWMLTTRWDDTHESGV